MIWLRGDVRRCLKRFHTTTSRSAAGNGGVLNSSRDDRALMRVRTPRGLTRISREACCRVIGIKMANGASIKGMTDFRLLSRARARARTRTRTRCPRRVGSRRFDVFVPTDLDSAPDVTVPRGWPEGRVTRFHCAEKFSTSRVSIDGRHCRVTDRVVRPFKFERMASISRSVHEYRRDALRRTGNEQTRIKSPR